MGVPLCAEVGPIPATGVPLREQRFSAKSQPLPPGARRGEPAEVVAARKRRALLWPLVRVRVGQTRAGVRFLPTVSPAGD